MMCGLSLGDTDSMTHFSGGTRRSESEVVVSVKRGAGMGAGVERDLRLRLRREPILVNSHGVEGKTLTSGKLGDP